MPNAHSKPRKNRDITRKKRELPQRLGFVAVLSDECELVSTRTMWLSLMPRRGRATR